MTLGAGLAASQHLQAYRQLFYIYIFQHAMQIMAVRKYLVGMTLQCQIFKNWPAPSLLLVLAVACFPPTNLLALAYACFVSHPPSCQSLHMRVLRMASSR